MPGKKGWPPHSCFRWKLTHITLHGGWPHNMQINRLQATAHCRCSCCHPRGSLVAVQGTIPHWVWLASTASTGPHPTHTRAATPHYNRAAARAPVRGAADNPLTGLLCRRLLLLRPHGGCQCQCTTPCSMAEGAHILVRGNESSPAQRPPAPACAACPQPAHP